MDSKQLADLDAAMEAPPSLRLRLARVDDAPYLFSLRVDENLNSHLSAAPSSVQAQADYLERYMQRESEGREYYFVIQNKQTGKDCGTVRIYDIQPDSFCWGSWILDTNKPRLGAIESALFVYDFGFGQLGFPASHFDVRHCNTRVISFHERMGAQRLREDEQNAYFSLTRQDLAQKLPELISLTKYRSAFLENLAQSQGVNT